MKFADTIHGSSDVSASLGGTNSPAGATSLAHRPRSARHAAKRRLVPVRVLLFGLVLAILLPTIGLGVVATWYAVSGERAAAQGRLTDAARDIALALDRDITGYTDAMIAFAASPAFGPDAAAPDLATLHTQVSQIANHLHIAVGIARPDGTRVLHSAHPIGAALPPMNATRLIEQVSRTRQPAVSDLVLGSLSLQPSIGFAAPVLGPDGAVALIAFAAIQTQRLQDLLREAAIPVGARVIVSDSQHTIIAASTDEPRLVNRTLTAASQAATADRSAGLYRTTGMSGAELLLAFHALRAAPGWNVFVAQPTRQIDRAWRAPLLLFCAGGLAALVLGGVLALLVARRILQPLGHLAGHARLIVNSDGRAAVSAAFLPSTRVAELEALRQGFAAAESTLRFRAEAERQAAAERAESERHLRALFEASPIGLARSRTDGLIVEANDVLLRILGVTREAMQAGQVRWTDLTAPESRGTTEAAIERAHADPAGQSGTYRKTFVRPNGQHVKTISSFVWLDRNAGEAANFMLDMTEAERTQERMEDLLATLDMGAFLTRALDGAIQHWSAGCERLYGFPAREAVGRRSHDLLRTAAPIPRAELDATLLRTGEWTGDLHHRTSDGRLIIVSAINRLRRNPAGEPIVLELLTDVTAQRHAEAALAESEAQLRAISTASPDLICGKDTQGRLTYANPAFVALLGRPAEDMLGRDFLTLHGDPANAVRNAAHDRIVIETGRPSTFEESVTRPDGTVRTYLSTKAPMHDPDTGAVIGIAVISRDVTDQRANQSAKARLAAIVASSPDAIISVSADGDRLQTWNHGAEALFGYTEAEAFGAPINLLVPDWLPEGDPSGVYRSVMRGETVHDHETVRRAKSGIEIPVSITAARMHADDGIGLGVAVIFRDLRPRLQAESALRNSEARWRTLAESFPGFVVETDAEGRNTYTNTRMQQLTGRSAEALLGDGWHAIIHPDDLPHAIVAWNEVIRTGDTYEVEYRFRLADGTYHWNLGRGIPQRDAAGAIVRWWIASIDITEIVAAREAAASNAAALESLVQARTRELETAHQRLAQAAKMEALGRLAGGIAHDFNNVLQAIQGGVALALKRLNTQPERVPAYLNLASEAAERGVAVTSRLLTFARRGELSAEPVALGPLLESMTEMLHHTLGPSIAVCVDLAPGLPPILVDKAQLETVLVNLANNARDAMPNAVGTIRLAADCDTAASSAAPAVGPFVRIAVIDDGAGMTPDVLARVSEPFFTTKPRGAGTGLGLAMGRGFAEQSGGGLAIESTPGRGTIISLWLPVAPAAGAPGADDGPAEDARLQPRSMLVVDDEPMVRLVVASMLSDQGHKVQEAENARGALALVESGMAVDLLVTDLAMPGEMDGLALIQAARRHHPGLPALLLTGHTGDAGVAALATAAETGPFLMLHKPITPEILREKVAALLGA